MNSLQSELNTLFNDNEDTGSEQDAEEDLLMLLMPMMLND